MSFNKKVLGKETKQARVTPPVKRTNKNMQPSFFMEDPRVLLPESFAQPMPPMYEEGGDIVDPGDGYQYRQSGNEYLTRRSGQTDWITATGGARTAIQNKIFGQSQPVAPATDPVQMAQTKQELKNYDINQTGNSEYTKNIQRKLRSFGYDLGRYGDDGVDGIFGNATKTALESFNSGISPQYSPKPVRTPKKTRVTQITKPTKEQPAFVVPKNLKPGILPVFGDGVSTEACIKGTQCSGNVFSKMGNLLGDFVPNYTDADGKEQSPLWGNDAWFNKDQQLKDGGLLIFDGGKPSNKRSDAESEGSDIPREMYEMFQVGDYVHMNRGWSDHHDETNKDGYKNSLDEHLGFIIGKDTDGTPLIWHGSASGKAFIQRMDQQMILSDYVSDEPDTGLKYKISSIVRNKALIDNVEMKKLADTAYYKKFNPNNKLVPTENATDKQKSMAEVANSYIEPLKDMGYDQDDVTYIGQLLVGGIMGMETKGGTSSWAPIKEKIAVASKNWLGVDPTAISFDEQDIGFGLEDGKLKDYQVNVDWKKLFNSNPEASRGDYQLKPGTNFKNKDGSANELEMQLNKLGYAFEDLTNKDTKRYTDEDGVSRYTEDRNATSRSAQTAGGMLMLLKYYDELKKDPKFNVETNMYDNKIPASYILSKSWQMGPGWYKKENFKNIINEVDIDYSRNALDKAINAIYVTDSEKSIAQEAAAAKAAMKKKKDDEYRAANIAYNQSAEGQAKIAEEARLAKIEKEYSKYNSPQSKFYNRPAESTRMNINNQPMPDRLPPLFGQGGMAKYPHGGEHGRPGIRTNADIEALANQGVVGDIPMYADEQGNARVAPRGGVYSAGRKKGQLRKGVYNQPVDYEQLYWDKEEGVKNQFLAPADASAKVPNWVPKGGLSREQSQGMSNLISGYKNDQGIRDAIDRKNFSSNGELTREQAYKLLKKDPSLYKSANDKMIAGYDKVTQSEDRGWKNRLAHNIIDKPLNTGVALVDDLYSGVVQPVLNSARSIYNDPGQLGYIPDAFKAAGQTFMPETFGETSYDPEYWANAQKGVIAAENLTNTLPIGYGVGKAASRLYKPIMKSSRGFQRVANPVINRTTRNSPKINTRLKNIAEKTTFDNLAVGKASVMVPYFGNEYRKNPTWQNAAAVGIGSTGFIPVIKPALNYSKGLINKFSKHQQGGAVRGGRPIYEGLFR